MVGTEVGGSGTAGKGVVPEEEVGGADKTQVQAGVGVSVTGKRVWHCLDSGFGLRWVGLVRQIQTGVGGTEGRTGKTVVEVGGAEVRGSETARTVVISEVEVGRTYRAEV